MRFALPARVRTVGAFSALSVTVAALAILHDGTETADLHLNDGGVWVTNLNLPGGHAVAAHLNYPSRSLDSYTEPAMNGFDLSQQANSVVLHDGQTRNVASVDTATWQSGAQSQLPQGGEAVQGAEVVAVADPNSGKVWVVPAGSPDTFSPENSPVLDDVVGVRISVGRDDTVHTVTPDGTLRDLVQVGSGWQVEEVGSVPAIDAEELGSLSVSASGATGVVLNRAAGWLGWPEHRVDVPDAAGAVLQQPGDRSDHVAVQTDRALLLVDLEEGEVSTHQIPSGGGVIAPVTVGDCTYAAWLGSGHYVRDCANDADDVEDDYASLTEGVDPARTQFRVNRDVVVLNDATSGKIFLVNEEMALIDDWSAISAQLKQDDEQDQQDDNDDRPFDRPKENRPPKANPDQYGVRAGQSVTLPVLANDTDPDGDILLAEVGSDTTAVGRIEPVRDGRAIRLVVDPDATGGDTFTYTANDGRPDGTSDAPVQLEVHPESQNAAPVSIRDSELTIVQRGSGEHRILQEWMDPDGDPFWIDSVQFPAGMDGVFRPDGLIKVNDDGTGAPGKREVVVALTDGRDVTDAVLEVQVKPRVPLPPTANADYVRAEVDEPVVVAPLTNDTDPNDDRLLLTQVLQDDGTQVQGDFSDGTFTVTGSTPGVHYLEYSISDGPTSAGGVVRFDVREPNDSTAKPIPDDDLAVLPASGEALVDVLSNDTDPLGGVLVLQSVGQGRGSGVTAEVVDHEVLRLHNNGLTGPVSLTYEVGNANGSSRGTVTVVQSTDDSANQTPLAYDDRATVRSGDVVSIDVLANDISPGDRPLHVQPTIDVVDGDGLGTAFVSEDQLRFKADGDAGTVRVKYTAVDPDLNASTATAEITIQPTSGSNSPPTPKVLTARLVEGGSTEIAVPLDDIDPDGDSATLLGLQDAPGRGVATVRGGVITYTSSGGDNGTGTDSFSYVVEDRFGATAVGTIRVGIAPPPVTNQPPITTPDQVAVRPDRVLSVPVAANDIDPEGEPLTLVGDSVRPIDEATTTEATPDEGRVLLTTPSQAGDLRYDYAVADDVGNVSAGNLTVEVSPDAPLQPPIARDDVVPLSDVLGKNEVTVDVLDNDEDPDGAASVLTPSSEVTGVTAAEDGRLVVPLLPERQVIVYSITDADGQTGQAVVTVPGTDPASQRPVLRNDVALPVQVQAGEELSLPVADYVAVREGRSPTVPFTENVQPGPGWDGGEKLRDQDLLFTSTPDFHGLTSITFLVTDALEEGEEQALSSTITIPIEVLSNGRTQPTLVAPEIEVTPGEDPWVRDLRLLATDPDPGDQEKLTFTVTDVPSEIDAAIGADGSTLTVSADPDTVESIARQITLTVSDGTTDPVSVPATVRVVASTRPLMTTRLATVDDADAGETVTVDLDDYVTNPYADSGEPIAVVGNPTVSGGAGTAVGKGSTVDITPGEEFHGTLTVTYVVADASGQADRQVQGQIRVNVRAAPDAPPAVDAVATKSHTVEVSWRAPANNGAPITGYTVSWTGGESGSRKVGNVTSLAVGDLTNNRDYTFTVIATNEVGDSDPSKPSRKARPDEVPAAPTNVQIIFGDGGLDVTWQQPKYEGSPVKKYEVSYNGQTRRTDGPARRITLTGLTNGQTYNIKVRGINDAETEKDGVAGAGQWSGTASEHPSGEPSAPTGISVDADGPDPDPSAVVSWEASAPNGHEVTKYEVRKNGGGTVPCAQLSATSCRVSLTAGEDAAFSVRGYNRANPQRPAIDGWGEWSANSAQVRGAKLPGRVVNLRAVPTGQSGQARVTFGDAERNGAETIEYRYQVEGSAARPITKDQLIGDLSDGTRNTIRVWAISTANGKQSEGGPEESTQVDTFSPCTGSVNRIEERYNSVVFRWGTQSHGRACTWQFSNGGGGGPGDGSQGGDREVSGGANGDTIGFTLTVGTRRNSDDPDTGTRPYSDSGRTWVSDEDWSAGRSCTQVSNCRRANLHLYHFKPYSSVYCYVVGEGGITSWDDTFTVNGNGEWGPGEAGWLYDSNAYNIDSFDNQACQQR